MFARLKRELAHLYPDEGSARRLATDVGLNEGAIDFDGSALSFWDQVVKQALRRQRIRRLVELAVDEYPESVQLQRIAGVFEYGDLSFYLHDDDNDDMGPANRDGNVDRQLAILATRFEGHLLAYGADRRQHEKDHEDRDRRREEERKEERQRFRELREDLKRWVIFSTVVTVLTALGGVWVVWRLINDVLTNGIFP